MKNLIKKTEDEECILYVLWNFDLLTENDDD